MEQANGRERKRRERCNVIVVNQKYMGEFELWITSKCGTIWNDVKSFSIIVVTCD